MKYLKVSLIETYHTKCSVCGSRMVDGIQRKGVGYIDVPENIKNIIDMAMDGESHFSIEPVEMTVDEFKALPEFTGF